MRGGTAGPEPKALVWKRNCRTPGLSAFLVWKLNYGNSKHYYTLKSTISHTNLLTLHNILCAEAELRNLKSQYISSAEAELRYRVT